VYTKSAISTKSVGEAEENIRDIQLEFNGLRESEVDDAGRGCVR
jgi:hypothetical protein